MKTVPKTSGSPVLRTDFSNDSGWDDICNEVVQPSEDGFIAYVEFIDDQTFNNIGPAKLLEIIPENFGHFFIIVVDRTSLASREHPLLIVDLDEYRGQSFRAAPSQIQSIENNLSIANMGFDEFAEAVDDDGIFRGFA
jgi:hypothetical protein